MLAARAASQHDGRRRLRRLRQPQDRRLQALRPAQRRPRPHLDLDRRRPAGARHGLLARRGSGQTGRCSSPAPSSASTSPSTAGTSGSSSRAACRPSRCATSRSRSARTTSCWPPSAAASTSSTTTPRCGASTRRRSTRAAILFPTAKAWLYVPSTRIGDRDKGFLGETYFLADNPPFGAVFTYYLKDSWKSKKKARQDAEKEAIKAKKEIDYPTLDALRAETRQEDAQLLFTVSDAKGAVVTKLNAPAEKGIHRLSWDLHYPPADPVSKEARPPGAPPRTGPFVAPGTYSVRIDLVADGEVRSARRRADVRRIVVDAEVAGERVEPRPKRAGRVVLIEPQVEAHEDLLRQVPGLVATARELVGEIQHAILVLADQRLPGGRVPSLAVPNQQFVGLHIRLALGPGRCPGRSSRARFVPLVRVCVTQGSVDSVRRRPQPPPACGPWRWGASPKEPRRPSEDWGKRATGPVMGRCIRRTRPWRSRPCTFPSCRRMDQGARSTSRRVRAASPARTTPSCWRARARSARLAVRVAPAGRPIPIRSTATCCARHGGSRSSGRTASITDSGLTA